MSSSIVPDPDSPRQLSLFDAVEIPLTQGYVALVDPEDSDLSSFRWTASVNKARKQHVYAIRGLTKPARTIKMHRVILERMLGRELNTGEQVDHKNGDKLDNRRSNLRLANHHQNNYNTPRQSNNTSGYKGVHWHKRRKTWIARIKVNRKFIHLGCFDSPEKAHAAYCAAAIKYAGEFARFE